MPLNSLLRVFAPSAPDTTGPPVRVAVIGAGRMGGFHAAHLARNPKAQLVAIVDPDSGRAKQVAKRSRTEAFEDLASVIGRIDAAVIATPTGSHRNVGCTLLDQGIGCLIEKPIAATPEEAEHLMSAAERTGAVLQVGHIERFNPAVIEAVRHIASPQFIEVSRLGPYDPRIAGIGVVLDLMIHDLDIVLFLVGRPVIRVEAFGAKVLSDHEDIAKVRLHFEGGCIADLSASRVSLKKYRTIRLFQKDAYLSLDYAAPKLMVYRKKGSTVKSLKDISIVRPRLVQQDPLALELDHFLDCVRDKRTPLVSGQHGRDALELAREVLASLRVL